MNVSGDPRNADTDGDCIRDMDELIFATLKGIDASDAILFADADNDGVPDGEQTDCGANLGTGVNPNEDDNTDNVTAPLIPDAVNPLDSTAARVLLGIVGVAVIALIIALVAIVIGGRESASGVVSDDSFDLATAVAQEEAFSEGDAVASDGLTALDTGPVLDASSMPESIPTAQVDTTLTSEPKILSTRDHAVGRHDGVHGAPLLDGFEFEGWTPQQVQDALNAGWTVDQLREHHSKGKQ
jgi:hypothetical protein